MVKPIKKIVVVGGGVVGWTVAAALISGLRAISPNVVVISHSSLDQPNIDDSTSPKIHAFHEMLGVSEKDVVGCSRGTFKAGVDYRNFRMTRAPFIHAFGCYGRKNKFIDFYQAAKFLTENVGGSYERFSLSGQSARQGKFIHPKSFREFNADDAPYGLHLCGDHYAAFLEKISLQRGAACTNSEIINVNFSLENSRVSSIELAGGEFVEGDIFVDCSRSGHVLSVLGRKKAVESEYLSIDFHLPYPEQKARPLPPVTLIERKNTAIWRGIPLLDRYSIGVQFKNKSDEEGIRNSIKYSYPDFSGALGSSIKKVGDRECFWIGNCIAIGESAYTLPFLSMSPLEIVRNSVVRLLDYFPGVDFSVGNSIEYNRLSRIEMTRVKVINELVINAFNSPEEIGCFFGFPTFLSAEAQRRLDLFLQVGYAALYDEDLYSVDEWSSLLIGMGFYPQISNALLGEKEEVKIVEWLNDVEDEISASCKKIPDHLDFLKHYLRS